MKLTINGMDYTRALDGMEPLTVERTLNAPSVCRFALSLPADNSLAAPARLQHVAVAQDDGTVLFTGYVAGAPLPVYAGLATEGARGRLRMQAVSDEMLLDALLPANAKTAAGMTAGALVANLAAHTGAPALQNGALSVSGLSLASPVSTFVRTPGSPFSSSAGQAATQVRAAYRAAGGALTMTAIPGAVHRLSEGDGTLDAARLAVTGGTRRGLANDVTVCGEHEAAAYVTEFFMGDGVTTQFTLGATPFFLPSADTNLIEELFDGPALDARRWSGIADTHFALGGGGLALQGESGAGSAQLAWLDPVEMGGTLLLEADGVALAAGSTGVLAGLYAAGVCVAGFAIAAAQGTGALTVQPLVKGALAGAPFAMDAQTQYTLRLRVHCDEVERTRATYVSFGDAGVVTTGGGQVAAAGSALFEVQPCVDGVLGMPVVLYDGAIADLPAACTVAAAASVNLRGSVRAVRLGSLGSAWVTSCANGVQATRRIGSLAESAECAVERTGKVVFYAGFVPAAGEQIAVRYRAQRRAVGRANGGGVSPATACWTGTVTMPRARSSADCRNAAAAMAQAAASTSALWSGTYAATQAELGADVWPGDALALDAAWSGMSGQVVVRAVKLTVHASVPDLVEYRIAFANDWAEDLAIRTSAAVPEDAWLPAEANAAYAPSLGAMTAAVTGNAITFTMNTPAPAGGGFEVRRRDGGFVPGSDPGLVARGTAQVMTLARAAAEERYYVRAFDGAISPNYSEFSAAVMVNVPMG